VGRPREPERTCVGCRRKSPKRSLLRIARTPAGGVALDATGSTPGRGAYVHEDRACVEAALSHGALWRALRTGADADTATRLRRRIEGAGAR
jgi:predicted RNA-binding protein YlxR (DUF448 family)